MKKIVIDANIPISFIHDKVDMWGIFQNYVKDTGCEIIMPIEVFDEVSDRKTKSIFTNNCNFITKIETNNQLYAEIKKDCESFGKNLIQDNDFKLITAAIDKKADILVTNDYELINVLDQYKKMKYIKKDDLLLLRAAGLLMMMHMECKNIFDWKNHIKANLKFYHHIEIPNTCDGMIRRKWNENFAKARFVPFQKNIIDTMEKVNV